MPHLDHKGPESKGSKSGRKLGLCKKNADLEEDYELGKGLGKRKKSEQCDTEPKAKRKKAGIMFKDE